MNNKEKTQLKKELTRYIWEKVFYGEGHSKLNGRSVKIKVTSFKETFEDYVCKGEIKIIQDDTGDGYSWKETEPFTDIKVKKYIMGERTNG